MEALNRNMRKLSRQYSDAAQKESSLKLVSEMLANSEAAKTMIPSQVAKLPEADQAKALEIYHKDMDTLSTELTTLKELITAGDAVAIKAQLDKLNDVKKSGHKDLGVKKGGPGGDRPHGPGPEEVH